MKHKIFGKPIPVSFHCLIQNLDRNIVKLGEAMTFWPRRRKIDCSIRSVGNVVATELTPFDKTGEMPADLDGWISGKGGGGEILVFVFRGRVLKG